MPLMKFELLKTIILTGCKAIMLLNSNSEPQKNKIHYGQLAQAQ